MRDFNHARYIMRHLLYRKADQARSEHYFTAPSVEHVVNEVVVEPDLGLGYGAGLAVKLRHHDWKAE